MYRSKKISWHFYINDYLYFCSQKCINESGVQSYQEVERQQQEDLRLKSEREEELRIQREIGLEAYRENHREEAIKKAREAITRDGLNAAENSFSPFIRLSGERFTYSLLGGFYIYYVGT